MKNSIFMTSIELEVVHEIAYLNLLKITGASPDEIKEIENNILERLRLLHEDEAMSDHEERKSKKMRLE